MIERRASLKHGLLAFVLYVAESSYGFLLCVVFIFFLYNCLFFNNDKWLKSYIKCSSLYVYITYLSDVVFFVKDGTKNYSQFLCGNNVVSNCQIDFAVNNKKVFADMQREISELKRMLKFTSKLDEDYISLMISYKKNVNHDYGVVSAGINDEIRINNAVVSYEGLVGKIDSVFDSMSEVMLASDKHFRIPVKIVSGDTDMEAVAVGNGEDGMYLLYTDMNKISNGDHVFTSQFSNLLGEIYVGEIKIDDVNINVKLGNRNTRFVFIYKH